MKALVAFDLVGPMAHFRRFYTNSSSLSYGFPPRTVLMGILAAIRGWERDSYYEALSVEKASIAVAVRAPARRIIQAVNYVRTKGLGEVNGSAGPTQVPLEFLLPELGQTVLRYRVFFCHEDPDWVEEIGERVLQERYAFPLYLGLTECPAWVENPRVYAEGKWQLLRDPSEVCSIETVMPVTHLTEAGFELTPGLRLYKDRIPLEFDRNRHLRRIVDVLWEGFGRPIRAQVRGRVFRTPELTGVFLE